MKEYIIYSSYCGEQYEENFWAFSPEGAYEAWQASWAHEACQPRFLGIRQLSL